jgi:NAD(P)-dependent dehydrogenase (short-subunit alcohol dehydrogenase family)
MSVRGKTVVLTGATSGIGAVAAERLTSSVGTLVTHGLDGRADVSADFTALAAVRVAADAILARTDRIDVLINNAGVPGLPQRTLTVDGYERTLQVNYLAMVALTACLRPALGPDSRVVNVGSGTHRWETLDLEDLGLERGYEATRAYARSKLAVMAYSQWLSRERDVITVCPGVNRTALIEAMYGPIGEPPSYGAAHLVHAAEADVPTGTYLHEGQIEIPSDEARDERVQLELMQRTRALLRGFRVGFSSRP